MSDFALPPYTPVYPVSKSVKPRQRVAKLPEWGIEQRKTSGLHQTSPEWSVRWVLAPADANILDAFLAERSKNGDWFLWTPPNKPIGRFRCDEWTKTLPNCTAWEVQARFRQIFAYNLPSVPAEIGRLTLGGVEAGLQRSRIMPADVAGVVLVGGDATLVKDLPMPVSAGSLALGAPGASFSRAFQLTANTATPTLTLQPATLVYFSLGGDYFSSLSDQVYGWDRDFQVDWWGD